MSHFPARPQHLAGKMVFLSYSGWSELKLYCSFKLDQLPFSNGCKHRIFYGYLYWKVWVLCHPVRCCLLLHCSCDQVYGWNGVQGGGNKVLSVVHVALIKSYNKNITLLTIRWNKGQTRNHGMVMSTSKVVFVNGKILASILGFLLPSVCSIVQ